jgi:3-hydroxyacyl-CoA dehydrogenase / enoyl-CoA hydratase / 3-hydroxybutyryl-CoA epimerase
MIRYKKDIDNIVTITLDMQDRPVNIITHEISRSFLPVIKHLQEERKKGQLRGVIVTSAKKSFVAGGDLDYIYHHHDTTIDCFEYSQAVGKFFRDLEYPGVPVVAAIHGAALGTGFGLALACHYRIATEHKNTQLGFPEIKFGLLPSGGTAVRLMWHLGLEKAYETLITGETFTAKAALKAGLIHATATDEKELMERAKDWLMQPQENRQLWDRSPIAALQQHPKDASFGALVSRLTAQSSKNRNVYPAQQSLLNTLVEGSKVDFDTAIRIESRVFTTLLKSKTTQNMIKALWYDMQTIQSGTYRPKGYGKFRVKKVGVIGAGLMGSGIAYTCAKAGLTVVLKDVSQSVAEIGMEYAHKKLDLLIQQEKITSEEKKIIMGRIQPTESSKAFEDCDIVIEAVFENQNVKAKVTKDAEQYLDEYSIFASNTSSILITNIATASQHPERMIGIHFFPPAEEIPLVEIVKGKQTSDETVARAFDFARILGKIPIIVKDGWGFYVARVQNTYILEGVNMLAEGYPAALIENLALQAGMPKGPLALADDITLQKVLVYERQAAELYGPKYIQHPAVPLLQSMLIQLNRSGDMRKDGGFYEKNAAKIWSELSIHFPTTQINFDRKALTERLLFAQAIEGVWCLQEGVIKSVEEANLGSIFGWGFPVAMGGVIEYVEDYGVENFIEQCKLYEKQFGPRFRAPKKLKEMAKVGIE